MEVFKLQRPLATSEPEPMVLAYNRARTVEAFIPFDGALRALFTSAGNPPKIYVAAEVRGTELHILGTAEQQPQPW